MGHAGPAGAAEPYRDVITAAVARGLTAQRIWQDLREAEATGTRRELVGRLCKVDLLVVEDLGMRRLPPTAAEDLLEVVTRRHEQGAIIITTNRPLEDWGQMLGDTAAASAILDRFLHHAEIIRLQGRSYRMHERQQRRKQSSVLEGLTGEKE